MNITAAVLGAMGAESPYAESEPLVIEKLQLDAPGPGEVLVRIKAAGLCHSDLSVINGNRPRPTPCPGPRGGRDRRGGWPRRRRGRRVRLTTR